MFHSNHLKMIEYARGLGDTLIVGVSTDELVASYKNPPIIPFEERIAIIGDNGSGKTTLLRLIEEKLRNDPSLNVALMPQHYEDGLDFSKTPVEYLNTDGSKEQKTSIRASLIAMKFSRDELDHPIRSLSGGQKAKVLLLKLMMAHPDVLLMDEPTRNLSPLSAPVMREMIRSFPGTVICVTHDRLLIRDWPGRVLRLTEKGLAPAE